MKNDHVAEPGPEGFELAALAHEATRSAIEALHDRKRLSDVIHALSMLDDACEKTSLSEIVAEHLRRNVTRKTPARHARRSVRDAARSLCVRTEAEHGIARVRLPVFLQTSWERDAGPFS